MQIIDFKYLKICILLNFSIQIYAINLILLSKNLRILNFLLSKNMQKLDFQRLKNMYFS